MKFFSPLWGLAAAATLLLESSPVFAASVHPSQISKKEFEVVPGRYIVEFSGGSVEDSSKKLTELLNGKFQDTKVSVVRSWNHSLMRGVSLQIDNVKNAKSKSNDDDEDLVVESMSTSSDKTLDSVMKALQDEALVANVYPVRIIPRPQLTATPLSSGASGIDLGLLEPHDMTQVDRVHKELKNKGKGIKVGVIDSGVDYKHEALGGCYGKGCKVAYGYDLVGDDYNAEIPGSTPKPDDDPLDDCGKDSGASGHGTHVSGIIAGKSKNFTGVAPEATLGMWRVFGCQGSASNDVIIQAMLDAYEAGVDIISMSLGDSLGWSESPDSVVAQRIVESGIPVIIAAGNEGASGAFTAGTPSVGHGPVSVASFDNNYFIAKQFTADGLGDKQIYSPSESSGQLPDGEIAIGDKNVDSSSDACKAENVPSNVKGKIGLVKRGSCTFDEKAANLAKAGAIGALVYNAEGDVFTPSTTTAKVPVAGISNENGLKLVDLLKAGKSVKATFDHQVSTLPVSTGKTVSSFSSVGPSYENDFKPEIAGIGGNVYSTLPRYLGGWGMMSGTSMATPYVAGAVALYLKQAQKNHDLSTKPKFITEQFQHYAYKAPNVNVVGVDSPLAQGAGLIQVYDTLTQGVHITPAAISFNDTANIGRTHKLTIKNNGDSTVSYQISNNMSVAIQPYDQDPYIYSEPVIYINDERNSEATFKFNKKTIKLGPGKSTTIKLTVTPPTKHNSPNDHIMYGGFIQFKSQQPNKHKDLTVPYFGIVGDQRKLPLFMPDSPVVTDENQSKLYNNKDDVFVFDPKNATTVPYFIYGFRTPTAHLKATLYTESGKALGTVWSANYEIGRNTLSEPYTATIWDGTYKPTIGKFEFPVSLQAPKGKYRIGWKALKLLGNPNKSQDWESWTSCIIQVV
ncbi:hypothetical protein LRAMOSA02547 [Lichtheimia ramosa]|uniref:Peptidase S8/S53 domain-containing protein n=1 Tax=Lichtheimia ramosa TaxID=688394 RepID=A0A077WR92_9FUNG|nr:hypothetical protein LRAMOSA02547 [Lichtheimia ramosa]